MNKLRLNFIMLFLFPFNLLFRNMGHITLYTYTSNINCIHVIHKKSIEISISKPIDFSSKKLFIDN